MQGVVDGIFFFIPAVDIFTAKGFNRCKDGYPDKHTQRPHDGTADQNGKDNPKGAQVEGVTENLGAQEVSVELLQNQNKQTYPDGQNRVNQQSDKDSRDGTDEGAKVGNHIGDPDNQAQNQREGGRHQAEPDECKNADDERVDGLANDEILKDMMDTVGIDEKAFRLFLGGEGINTLAEFVGKAFFIIKHIKGDKDGHDELEGYPTEYIDIAGNGFNYLRGIFRCMLERRQNAVDYIIDIFTVDKGNLVEDMLDTDIHGFGIYADIRGKGHDGFLYFWNQINHNPDGAADDDGIIDEDSQHTGGFWMPFQIVAAFFQQAVKKIHKGIHHIGNGKAHQEGGCQCLQIAGGHGDAAADAGKIADHLFK